jgi:hypothetical protein
MAAIATTYVETGRSWAERVAQRNAELMGQQQARRRRAITPEYRFARHFDNSRLVKAADPVRARQMRVFLAAIFVLCSLVMFYGLQHFSAIESGYKVEARRVCARPWFGGARAGAVDFGWRCRYRRADAGSGRRRRGGALGLRPHEFMSWRL